KGDRLIEPDDNFFVTLSAPSNATLAKARGEATILNDDTLPTMSIGDVSVKEGDTGTVDAGFAVTLSHPMDEVVTVDFATADGTALAGSDYVGTQGKLTFN